MKALKPSTIKNWIIGIFVGLYTITSIVSTIHVIDFFDLSNPHWLSIILSIAFELGAMACLAAIVILDKTSRWMVWVLFSLITAMQMSGNMYYAYTHLENYRGWIEMFGLEGEDPLMQKRILSFVSGGILPLVALGFIKSLVDYIKPAEKKSVDLKKKLEDEIETNIKLNDIIEEPLTLITDTAESEMEKDVDSVDEAHQNSDTYKKAEEEPKSEIPVEEPAKIVRRRGGL